MASATIIRTWPLLNNDTKNTRVKYFKKTEIKLTFARKDHQKAAELSRAMPEKQFNTSTGVLVLMAEYLTADTAPLMAWMDESPKLSSLSMNRQIAFLDLQAFLSRNQCSPDLAEHIDNRITLTRRMGLYANMAISIIELGYLQLPENQLDDLENTLANLNQYNLDWWELDLFKIKAAMALGDIDAARQLATEAKEKSAESWDEEAQKHHNQIMTP